MFHKHDTEQDSIPPDHTVEFQSEIRREWSKDQKSGRQVTHDWDSSKEKEVCLAYVSVRRSTGAHTLLDVQNQDS